jgi:hypothetical protein
MSLKKIVSLGAVIFFVMLPAGCAITIFTPLSTKGYVKFINKCKTSTGGTEIQYKVRNISSGTLSIAALPSEIAYNSSSSVIETTPHTGKFTVKYDVCPANGSTWVAASDTCTLAIVAGDTTTVALTLPPQKKGYVKFLNACQVTVSGTTTLYKVRNISSATLAIATISSEIPYGSSSNIIETTPHTGSFTVNWEACPATGGSWVAESNTFSLPIVAGDTATVALTLPPPKKGYVKFLNACQVTVSGTTTLYKVRNISSAALAIATISSEIPYGSSSNIIETTPHTGSFTVNWEACPTSGGAWIAGSDTYILAIVAGDTTTVALTLPPPKKGYVKFLNICNQKETGSKVLYKVRNISSSTLSIATIASELAYGSSTAAIETTPHTGSFTVNWEACPATGGSWVAESNTFSLPIVAGDTTIIALSMPLPQKGYVRFLNLCKVTVIGAEIQYKVRNISSATLSIATITSEIAYNNSSQVVEATPHTGSFNVNWEVCPANGGSWVAGSDTFNLAIVAGDTTTIQLSMSKFKK